MFNRDGLKEKDECFTSHLRFSPKLLNEGFRKT